MSRRKQLKPKSIKGGGQEPVATVPLEQMQVFSDDDEFDDGYRPLIISAEDPSEPKPSDSEDTQQHYGTASLTTVAKDTTTTLPDDKATSDTKLNKHHRHRNRPILNTLNKSDNHHDANSITHSECAIEAETTSSEHNSELDRPLTGYSSNPESLGAMTLGQMEGYHSDDSQEYGAGKLVISPAIYRGSNPPIPKPRQPTPSKTRRKSDKIVPVVTPEGQKYICPVCKISLCSNGELTAHIRSHNTSSAINTCTICGKVLSSQSSLDRHMLVHSGERPFRCKICDMSFTTNGNMHRHSRIHGKEGNTASPALHTQAPKETRDPTKPRRSRPSNLMSFSLQSPSGGVKRKHGSDDDVPNHSFLLAMESQENSHLMDRENAEQNAQSPDKAPTQAPDNDALTCPVCLKTFLVKYGLDTHFEQHADEPATCQLCQLSLPSGKMVYLHYFIAHVDRKKLQELTQSSPEQKNGLAPLASGFHELSFTDFSIAKFAHIAKVWCEKNQRRSNSIYQNYHCRKCDHAFPSADVLRMHSEMHPNVCDVTCKTCDVTFDNKQAFEDHIIQHSSSKVVDGFSKKVGTDDNDLQDMLTQPEFLLALGLKSTDGPSDWCNNNAIERAASRYASQIATPIVKPINHVTPIVIEPKGDLASLPHLTRADQPSGTVKHFAKQKIPHPAFPSRIPSIMSKSRGHHVEKAPVEISSSSDGEGDGDLESSIDKKPFQCIICEYAYSNRALCEKHCRSDHGLQEGTEINSAIKHNPFSGQRRINPTLSFMPYLCKKCTNGFSNKDNCIKHLLNQHGVRAETVLHHIATNKRLSEQPSYLAGVKDAQTLIKNAHVMQRGRVGSGQSAFIRPMNSTANLSVFPVANPSTYITSPPITPIVMKQEASDNDQPLDFSMKKEPQVCDFTAKRVSPKPEVASLGGEEMPMDLSCKPGANLIESTSRVAPHNVVSSSLSCHSEPPPIHVNVRPPINAFLSPRQPVPLPANAAVMITDPITDHSRNNNGAGSSNVSLNLSTTAATAAAAAAATNVAPMAAAAATSGIPTPRFATPLAAPANQLHAPHLQHFYVPALGKFQCAHCRLLFKNSYQLQCHLMQQHNPQRPLYRCKHCPATYDTKASIEKHILNVHPQIHAPLFVHTKEQKPAFILPKSAQSSPALSSRDATASPKLNYNSDSDLSSVTKMLDCASSASNFKAFFTSPEVNESSSKYLQPGVSSSPSPNPIHALQQITDKNLDESGMEGSVNCSPDGRSTPCDEPPMKRKRNSYSDSPHKLQCPYCPRAFPWISSLKRHILTHTGQKPFKCPECPVTFSTKSNRERHMVRKHGLDLADPQVRARMDEPYSCHVCNTAFTSAGNTRDHYREIHDGKDIPDYIVQQAKFELLSCAQNQDKLIDGQIEAMSVVSDMSDHATSLVDFDDEEDEELDGERMKKAVRSATLAATPSPTPMSSCSSPVLPVGPEMASVSLLDDDAPEYLTKINPERDNYNVDRITGCWKCNMQFDSRKILLRHLKDHNIDHSYKCYLCDASFESRVTCLQHTETVHRHDWILLRDKNKCYNISEYASNCETQVQETLANLGLTGDAEEMDVTPKPAAGDEKGNADSDYAQRKVFCSFCVKRFWSLQDLRRHMRSHTGERPFECDVCQKRFTLKHSMMRHRRKHTPAELASASERVTSPLNVSTDVVHHMDDDHVHQVEDDVVVRNGMIASSMASSMLMNTLPISMATAMTTASMFGAAPNGNGDLLHNLLGVDSSKIDELLQTQPLNAAKLLGVGDKSA